MTAPVTKLSVLRGYMAAGEWPRAIAAAAKFPRLGAHARAIMQAREACVRPAFQRQIGRDPATLIAAGIAALNDKYGGGE